MVSRCHQETSGLVAARREMAESSPNTDARRDEVAKCNWFVTLVGDDWVRAGCHS
jgi:hypothetical protein